MPLKGTAREQKHYRRIRKEYPEKGKEYAARVARNIVRANTPGGRKLKGTTEYGRDWGPPYSQPLSKKGELMDFFAQGKTAALEKLGLRLPGGLGTVLLPAAAGAGLGALSGDEDTRLRNTLIGALMGAGAGAGGIVGKSKALTGSLTGARHYSPTRSLLSQERDAKALLDIMRTPNPKTMAAAADLSPYIMQDVYQGIRGLRGQLKGTAAGAAGGLGLGAGAAALMPEGEEKGGAFREKEAQGQPLLRMLRQIPGVARTYGAVPAMRAVPEAFRRAWQATPAATQSMLRHVGGGAALGGAAGAISGDDYSLGRILGGAALGGAAGAGLRGLRNVAAARGRTPQMLAGTATERAALPTAERAALPPAATPPVIARGPGGVEVLAGPRQAGQEAAMAQLGMGGQPRALLPQRAASGQRATAGAIEAQAARPSPAVTAGPSVRAAPQRTFQEEAQAWMASPRGQAQMRRDLLNMMQSGRPLRGRDLSLAHELGLL